MAEKCNKTIWTVKQKFKLSEKFENSNKISQKLLDIIPNHT
jgi:hypothetical protein